MARTAAFDIAIIGAGMAGASAAFFLAEGRRVLILEREGQPGYHATGRSAALYTQAYGNAAIRALTVASKPFFDHPPERFVDAPLLRPRGALFIARSDQISKLEDEARAAQQFAPNVRLVDAAEARRISPALRADYIAAGAYEPDAMDIDVHALLHGFLAGARHKGAMMRADAHVRDLAQLAGGWRIETTAGPFEAEIVVNAAGAWASDIGRMAGAAHIEIMPKRRTAFLFKAPQLPGLEASPLTVDVDEMFYFKPEAGLMLGSPCDESLQAPQDIQPENWDIAVGVDRIQQAANLPVRRIERRWAGLRSFAPDKTPVVGFDQEAPGFFWLAGQGGYGIQTAPAMGAITAALIDGVPAPDPLARLGFSALMLTPTRFATGRQPSS